MTISTFTATVTITGLPKECTDNIVSASSLDCGGAPKPRYIDEFGTLSKAKIEERLAEYYKNLEADPNATGSIVNYGKPGDVGKREKLIRDVVVTKKKIDASRLVFVNGGVEKTVRTRLGIVPAGADPSSVN